MSNKNSARGFAAIRNKTNSVPFFNFHETFGRLVSIHNDPPAEVAAGLRDLQSQLEAVWRRQDGSLHRNYEGYEPGRLLAHIIETGAVSPVDDNEGRPIDPERFGFTGPSLAAALRRCDPPIWVDDELQPISPSDEPDDDSVTMLRDEIRSLTWVKETQAATIRKQQAQIEALEQGNKALRDDEVQEEKRTMLLYLGAFAKLRFPNLRFGVKRLEGLAAVISAFGELGLTVDDETLSRILKEAHEALEKKLR